MLLGAERQVVGPLFGGTTGGIVAAQIWAIFRVILLGAGPPSRREGAMVAVRFSPFDMS
jgi:hypothetical protein